MSLQTAIYTLKIKIQHEASEELDINTVTETIEEELDVNCIAKKEGNNSIITICDPNYSGAEVIKKYERLCDKLNDMIDANTLPFKLDKTRMEVLVDSGWTYFD